MQFKLRKKVCQKYWDPQTLFGFKQTLNAMTLTLNDIRVLLRRKDLFPHLLVWAAFMDGTAQTFESTLDTLGTFIDKIEEIRTLDTNDKTLQELRPSYLLIQKEAMTLGLRFDWLEEHLFIDDGTDDPLSPFRISNDYKHHWAQWLSNSAPGAGIVLDGQDRPWYVSGHIIPNAAFKILVRVMIRCLLYTPC